MLPQKVEKDGGQNINKSALIIYLSIHTHTHTHIDTYCFSCVQLFATPQSIVSQAFLSMGLSRQYWSGLQFPIPGYLYLYLSTYLSIERDPSYVTFAIYIYIHIYCHEHDLCFCPIGQGWFADILPTIIFTYVCVCVCVCMNLFSVHSF